MMRSIFLFLLLVTVHTFAQQRLSLKDVIQLALKKSFDIQIAQSNLTINRINNDYGVAGGLPSLGMTISDNEQLSNIRQKYSDPSKNNLKDNIGVNTLTGSLTGSILLYNGQRVVSTKKRLEQLQLQGEHLLNAQIQSTVAGVIQQYYTVVKQTSYIKAFERSLEVARKKLDILNTRKEVGLSNDAEIFQAEVDVNSLKSGLISQELAELQSKSDLLALLYLKSDSTIIISDSIDVDRTILLDSIRQKALLHPQILAIEDQITINRLIEKETAAKRYPSINGVSGYNLNSSKYASGYTLLNQSYGPYIGLNVSIPIYYGNTLKKQQEVAVVNTEIAEKQKASYQMDYEALVVKAYQGYRSSLKQIETAEENYQLSVKLVDLILKRFQLAQATIIDVRQAEQTFENASFTLENAKYTAKINEIQLKQLASSLQF